MSFVNNNNSSQFMSSNVGRYRTREPPSDPRLGGTWGANPFILYGSNGRTHTPGNPSLS